MTPADVVMLASVSLLTDLTVMVMDAYCGLVQRRTLRHLPAPDPATRVDTP